MFVNGCRFVLDISFKEDFPYHLLIALFSLLYSLALVLIKFLMINYILLSPYIFLFYDGIFCILNSIIITFLQWPMIINIPDKNMNYGYGNDDNMELALCQEMVYGKDTTTRQRSMNKNGE